MAGVGKAFLVGLAAMVATVVCMMVAETGVWVAMGSPSAPPDATVIPVWAALGVLAGSVGGALLAGQVIGRLVPERASRIALVHGTLFTVGQVVNLQSVPHPMWFWVPGLLAFLPPVWWSARRAAGR